MTIGERIRYCRKRVNITQSKLAELTEIHPVSIRKYGTNKMQPQPAQIKRIAAALGVSYYVLTGSFEPGSVVLETDGDLMRLLIVLLNSKVLLIDGYREADYHILPENIHIRVNQLLEPYFQITSVNKSDFSLPLSKFELAIQNQDICSKLSCWDAVYNEWENASVIAKMAKDPTAILDDVTRRKEMLEIELQCSNYYLDMSDGVQHPVPKPDYTENAPESFLSSLLKKKED